MKKSNFLVISFYSICCLLTFASCSNGNRNVKSISSNNSFVSSISNATSFNDSVNSESSQKHFSSLSKSESESYKDEPISLSDKAEIISVDDFVLVDNKYCLNVSNSTFELSLEDKITTSPYSQWKIAKDKDGNNVYDDKKIQLYTGINSFYVIVISQDKSVKNSYEFVITVSEPYYIDLGGYRTLTCYDGEIIEIEPECDLGSGYNFVGWTCNGEIVSFPYEVKSSVTFDVEYEIVEFTINYDYQGGEVEVDNYSTYNCEMEFYINNPHKDGYDFIGWDSNIGSLGTNAYIYRQSCDLELYATWAPSIYNITYDYQGGSINENNPTSYTFGDEVIITNPSKNGYMFVGWSVNGSEECYLNYSITSDIFGDILLTAVWLEI